MSLRRMATGFAALTAATLFAQVSGFVVMVVLARRLAPEQIGAYSFALSLTGYFAIPANFGVTALATRDLVQRPQDARQIMGEVVSLQAVISLIPYLALVAFAPVLAIDGDSRMILPIVGLGFVIEGLLFQWVLYGSGRFGLMALARVLGAAAFAGGSLWFVEAGPNAVTTLGWVTLAGVVATSAITGIIAVRDHGLPRVVSDTRELTRRFRLGVPLGVAAVMISIYYTVDSVMLGYIESADTVGKYAIAYKIPLALINVGALWGAVYFPHASALAVSDRGLLSEHLNLFGSVACVGALPVLAGSILVGGDLMPRLFGPEYAVAAPAFVLLMAAAALIIASYTYGVTAIAIGDERHYAIAVTLGAVANIAINAVAIPLFGMVGAASATIAAEVVVFVYIYMRLRRLLGPLPLQVGRIARALMATAIMVAVLVPLHELTVLVRVFIGIAIFVAAGWVLRVVRPEELRRAMRSETSGAPLQPVPTDASLGTPEGPLVP